MTEKERESTGGACACPYCDATTAASLPICQTCGAEIIRCARCGKVLTQGETVCPACGGEAEKTPRKRRHKSRSHEQ